MSCIQSDPNFRIRTLELEVVTLKKRLHIIV